MKVTQVKTPRSHEGHTDQVRPQGHMKVTQVKTLRSHEGHTDQVSSTKVKVKIKIGLLYLNLTDQTLINIS